MTALGESQGKYFSDGGSIPPISTMIGIQTCACRTGLYLFILQIILQNERDVIAIEGLLWHFFKELFMSKLRAAAYCRVSSNKNIQLHSLEAQKRYYEEYFKDHPLYEYVGIYALTG